MMKQKLLSLVFVFSLFFPAMHGAAQEGPTPVPEATAETAGVGETGPAFETSGQQLGMKEFITMVVQDANVAWAGVFQDWGYAYVPPTFVTVEAGGYARSGCGINAGNPLEDSWLSPAFYCPYGGELGTQVIQSSDVFETQVTYEPVIYLSLPWLEDRLAASVENASFAVAYLVTYELSNHVQSLLGYIDHTGGGCCDYTDVQIQLMADCLTGVWAFSAYDKGQLEESDIEAAQTAAWGDGTALPQVFGLEGDHGTPEERLSSLMAGFQDGNPGACFEVQPAA
jgi:predicted metalloprotease